MPQQDFIRNSGLPLEPEFANWSDSHSFREAIQLFDSYSDSMATSRYINTFKQYEGWLLLTRYSLLSQGSGATATDIKLIFNRLIEAKYEGYGLLYYMLDYLASKGEPPAVLSDFALHVIKISATSSNQPGTPVAASDIHREKPLPHSILELINTHIEQKSANNKYLEQIRTFL